MRAPSSNLLLRFRRGVGAMLLAGWLGGAAGSHAQTVQTLAGGRLTVTGADAGFVDGDSLAVSQFHEPSGLAGNSRGDLFVADTANGALRQLDFTRDVVTTLRAGLDRPVAVAVDATDNVYVLTHGDGRVVEFDRLDALYQFPTLRVSGLSAPTALALGPEGTLWVVEAGGTLKAVDRSTGAVRLVAHGLVEPRGVAVLASGVVAVSEAGAHRIRLIEPTTGAVLSQIGTGAAGFRDGPAEVAQFNRPAQLARAPNGSLVVADRLNHRVRWVGTDGLVTTVYGVDPSRWEGPCLGCVPMILPGWFDGVNGAANTAEAREPVGVYVDPQGTLYASEVFYHILRRVSGTGLGSGTGAGGGEGVATPSVSPSSGYYPMGVTIRVTDPNRGLFFSNRLYYTTDGSEPGPNNPVSRQIAASGGVGTIPWRETLRDLAFLRVKAFVGEASSPTVRGQAASANQVGFAGDAVANPGARALLPVVVNLKAGAVLRSVQFIVEVAPQASAPALLEPIVAMPMSGNDFVPLVRASSQLPISGFSRQGTTARLQVAYLTGWGGFQVADFGVVALLAVPIPASAQLGDRYTLRLTTLSGTTDGQQTALALEALPARVLEVGQLSYLVGDSARGGWYNAGGFGDDRLDNADVNNAFSASVGVRVPFSFSDAFDALDVFPLDTATAPGGDGQIRFLDWQILLERSLGLRHDNWRRTRGPGGQRVSSPVQRLVRTASRSAPAASGAQPGLVAWRRQVKVSAGSVEFAKAGTTTRVPIRVALEAGATLAGFQCWPVISAKPDGTDSEVPAWFEANRDTGIAAPSVNAVPGLSLNNAIYVWDLGKLDPPLVGDSVLGWLVFQVPPSAPNGLGYYVRFANADGAPLEDVLYDFETVPGRVWVHVAAPEPAAILSDEWKLHFFASLTSSQARPEADPDGDGLSNRAEYLLKSHPTRPDWRLTLVRQGGGNILRWFAEQGRAYVLLASPDLREWRALGPAMVGADQPLEFADPGPATGARFYRVSLVP